MGHTDTLTQIFYGAKSTCLGTGTITWERIKIVIGVFFFLLPIIYLVLGRRAMYEHFIEILEKKFPGNNYQVYWFEDEQGQQRESLMINDKKFYCSWSRRLDSIEKKQNSLTYEIFLDIIVPHVKWFLEI